MSKGVLCSLGTDRQTDTKVTAVCTLSGFQEFFLQPIIKDRPKTRFILMSQGSLIPNLVPMSKGVDLGRARSHTQKMEVYTYHFVSAEAEKEWGRFHHNL